MASTGRNETDRSKIGRERMETRMKTILKLMILALLFLTVFIIAAQAAEAAGVGDTFRTTWNQVKDFVLSGKYWVNGVIIFGFLTLLYILLLAQNSTDNTQKVMIYIVLGLFALAIASKFVDTRGDPMWLWDNDQIAGMIRFTIGPDEDHLREYSGRIQRTCTAEHSQLLAFLDISPNLPCCGPGVYIKEVNGKEQCKQAILRTNDGGTGLPAFLFASIMFTLLFLSQKSVLGFDKLGSKGGTWFPILLGALLGAMMANQRVSKSAVLMIGGWVAVIMIGSKLSKSFGGENDKKGSKKGFGFGLAFAFIELIENMLGASLIGRSPEGGITFTTVLFNIGIGMLIGWLYSSMAGKGIFGKIFENLGKKKRKEIDDLCESDDWRDWLRAFGRTVPILGWASWFRPREKMTKQKERTRRLQDKLDKLEEKREAAEAAGKSWRLIEFYEKKIADIEEEIAKIEIADEEMESDLSGASGGEPSSGSDSGGSAASEPREESPGAVPGS